MSRPIDHRGFPRPSVTVSYAQTLDGRIATLDGSSQWISGPESLSFAHELRASHGAVMVGVGTVLRDNPRLTVRMAEGPDPLRVVVDSWLRTPLTAAVLANGAASKTLICANEQADPMRCEGVIALGGQVLQVPASRHGELDLNSLLLALGRRGIGSVMVEGGARLITSLLRERLVDRLAVCVAPKVLGRGIEAVGDLGISDLSRCISLVDQSVAMYGRDIVIEGRVVYPAGEE